jgi:hypothetical protein
MRLIYGTDNIEVIVDGVTEGTDGAASVTIGLNWLDIGQSNAAAAQLTGLVGEINIYSTPEDTYYAKKQRRGYSFSELTTFGVSGWNPTASGTMVALITTSTPADSLIMGSYDDDDDFCCLRIRDDRLCGGIGDEDWGTIIGTTKIEAQKHYFVAITWNGATVNLYLDENLEYSGAQSGVVAGTYPIAIGAISNMGDSVENHKGDIFQAATFDFALDVAQLRDFRKLMYKQVNHV